jgi:hypothetical protein
MSVEQIEQSLLSLGSDERRNFAEWFFEHEEELLGEDYDHPTVQKEILRRRAEALADPKQLEDWDRAVRSMKRRFDELRDKNPQAG